VRYRLNLQWKILLLAAGLMTAITLASSYLHGVSYLALASTLAASVLPLYLLFVYYFRRPSRDIVRAMERARGGDPSARAAVLRDDELGDIARGFNRLMDELGERERERDELLRRISGFNDELAHEIGTPLNVISGHLQLLARGRLDPDTERRLDIINNQIDFIVRTVRGLLEQTHRDLLTPAGEAEAAGAEVKADAT
jgi:two-component system NtrC family sensor kinase